MGGGVCRCGELTTQEEESSPWGRSMVLLAAMLLAEVGGEQLLGGLVNMAHHQRYGGGALGLNQGRGHGQNQGDQQKQRFDLHGYLLGDRK